ncbi:MAG TPA: hypothetical protein VEX43_02840 [Chthoniobacterales bacterium]|nr:hypothetical protein [Chthoniobacterales bacterium]
MKPLLTLAVVAALLNTSAATQQSVQGRKLTDLKVIPTRVLQRSISPKFYKSLLVSPLEGWIIVRANLSGTSLSGARVIRSDRQGVFDPLALQLAKEARIAGNYSIERPNSGASVLLHLLVYQIADGTMVLSFAHLDEAGGDQADYYGCARLLVLKNDKWTEIQGPESLAGKGIAVRRGIKNDTASSIKLEGLPKGAESTNMGTVGRDR